MITFNRSQVIGAEFIDADTIKFNGIQEDHIYGMEISMEVQISNGVIHKIDGNMKRYTNFVCPKAVPVLQTAVGMSFFENDWEKAVMREIGRKGCEHFAEIIIECGRSLDQALKTRDLGLAIQKNPSVDQKEYLRTWVRNPEKGKSCV